MTLDMSAKSKATIRKARQIQSGLNHDDLKKCSKKQKTLSELTAIIDLLIPFFRQSHVSSLRANISQRKTATRSHIEVGEGRGGENFTFQFVQLFFRIRGF